jgi:hypothetical protein
MYQLVRDYLAQAPAVAIKVVPETAAQPLVRRRALARVARASGPAPASLSYIQRLRRKKIRNPIAETTRPPSPKTIHDQVVFST